MMWSLRREPQMPKQSIVQHSLKTAKLLEYSAHYAENQRVPGQIHRTKFDWHYRKAVTIIRKNKKSQNGYKFNNTIQAQHYLSFYLN